MLRSKIHIKRKGALFAVLFTSIFALIGLTIAFNSDLKIFGNLFKAGTYEAEYREEFTSPTDWTPCTETPKLVTVKNNSPVNIKVRLKYDEFWRNKTDTQDLPLTKDGTTLAVINFQNEEDWIQHGEWYYYKEDLAPEAVTSSLFKSVTLDCNANLAVEKVCHETPNGTVCEEPDDDDAYDKYHLAVTIQTSDEDFPRTDEHYTVTIDPNGGTYNDSTEVYSESLNYGTVVDLTGVALDNHEIVNWTLNGTETYTGDTITVHDNITLTANWQSIIFHTITVNPNGGTLDGNAETVSTQVRQGETFTLSPNDPIRDGFLFDGWQLSNGTMLTGYSFTVQDDETITATWSPIIAQNNRTSKFYRSITAAEAEASSGDTISLVADAEEEFTNTKSITLDLNTLNLNGSIINNGTLTLLNGEVNNDAGAAVTNNGTLTMGINDYKDDGTVDIKPNYIRLIGTETGLKQNGQFNFYDGFIEGDIALDGGYNDSPFYRKTFDEEIVHFFPFIDKNQEKDCQHAALESSDLAVSKTAVNGDIYYYSIQDNINTSIRTGYKIYIVREGFSTGEPLTVPEDTDITIDIDGHTFTATDTITVDGKLTIEDGKSTINSETGEVEYAGNIQTLQMTKNYGELIMVNSRMTGTTTNDAIRNYATLVMRGGRLGATSGHVMRPVENATQDLDEKSSFHSISTNNSTIYLNSSYPIFEFERGTIYSAGTAIQSYTNSKTSKTPVSIQITGGSIISSKTGIETTHETGNNYSCVDTSVSIVNANIAISATTGSLYGLSLDGCTTLSYTGENDVRPALTVDGTGNNLYGISGGKTSTLTDLDITITGSNSNDSLYGVSSSKATINNLNITAKSPAGKNIYGISSSGDSDAPTVINNTNITIDGSGGTRGYSGSYATITGGSITMLESRYFTSTSCSTSTTKNYIYGFYANGNVTVQGTTANVYGITNTPCYYSYGFYSSGNNNKILEGTNIIEYGSGGLSAGAYNASGSGFAILGGHIKSAGYGVYTANDLITTIGKNDGTIGIESPEIMGDSYALYNNTTGYYKYYDGVLRGGIEAYEDGVISAIPDGSTYHTEESEDYAENCWLINATNYLQVGETEYNSLAKAYDAITGDTGTIKVIADVTIEALLPNNPAGKTIIFDLNGHQLTYTQPLINYGSMTFTDSSVEKTGRLSNPTINASTVANYGTLSVESTYLSGAYRTISNYAGSSSLTVNNSTIESTGSGVSIYTYTNSKTSKTPVSIQITGGSIISSKTGIETTHETGNNYSCVDTSVSIVNANIAISATTGSLYGLSLDGCTTLSYTGENDVRPALTVDGTGNNLYGISGGKTSTLTDLDITITGSNSNDSLYGVSSSKATINNLNITAKSPAGKNIYGISSSGDSDAPTVINNTNITIDGSGGTRGYSGSYATITGGSITMLESRYFTSTSCSTSTTKNYIYGFYANGNVTVQGTTANVYGITNTPCYYSYGFYSSGNNNKILEGTNIIEYGSGGLSAGAYNASGSGFAILGGHIKSAGYGVYTANDLITTIGKNDGTIGIESPEIMGDSYALYNNTTGYYKYYDGVLRGGIEAYEDGIVKAIQNGAAIHLESQTINGIDYETRWLLEEYDVAKIGETKYQKLSDAIDAAQTSDTIELLTDNYVFTPLAITDDKNFIIDTKGFDIFLGNPISNSGKVSIINSTDSQSSIIYHHSDYVVTNNTGAELSLADIRLSANYGVNNSGTLRLSKTHIDTQNTCINNSGTATAQNDITLSGSTYPIYNDGGETTIADAILSGKSIYNNSGSLSLNNSTAVRTGDSIYDFVTNNGTLTLKATSIALNSTKRPTSGSRTIYNIGNLSIMDNSTISHTINDSSNVQNYLSSAIYNSGGTVYVSGSNISLDTTSMKSYTTENSYAAYSPTGSFIIESGSITSSAYGPSYGIYSSSGTITIGVAEPTTSPNYGGANADVAQDNPSITAISTNNSSNSNANYKIGVGVKTVSGRVSYYDGKVSGSTASFGDEPTITEHFYEPCTELDTSVTPNLYTTHLFWMRDGQSSCANN